MLRVLARIVERHPLLLAVNEAIGMGLQGIRAYKMRAFLTILGVVMGIMTVTGIVPPEWSRSSTSNPSIPGIRQSSRSSSYGVPDSAARRSSARPAERMASVLWSPMVEGAMSEITASNGPGTSVA